MPYHLAIAQCGTKNIISEVIFKCKQNLKKNYFFAERFLSYRNEVSYTIKKRALHITVYSALITYKANSAVLADPVKISRRCKFILHLLQIFLQRQALL